MKFKQVYRVKNEDTLVKYLEGKELKDSIENILPYVHDGKKVYMHVSGSEHNYNLLKETLKNDKNFFDEIAKNEVANSIIEYDAYFKIYGNYDMVVYDIV